MNDEKEILHYEVWITKNANRPMATNINKTYDFLSKTKNTAVRDNSHFIFTKKDGEQIYILKSKVSEMRVKPIYKEQTNAK